MSVHIEPLTGDDAIALLPSLAQLRIDIFREYPYLYDGDLDYEEKYLHSLATSKDAIIVGAYQDDRLVGASTGAPLITQQEAFQAPFDGRGISLEEVFYFGESVLLPEFRGRGFGHAFFDEREDHARSLEGIRVCAFCSVIRPEEHPAKPSDYRPHDRFWQKRGSSILEDAVASFAGREVGDAEESEHPMQFWMRPL